MIIYHYSKKNHIHAKFQIYYFLSSELYTFKVKHSQIARDSTILFRSQKII